MDRGAWQATVRGVAESQAQPSDLAQQTSRNPFTAALHIFWGNLCFINQIIYNQKLWQVESKDGKIIVELLHYQMNRKNTGASILFHKLCFRSNLILSLLLHFVTILVFF